MVGYSSLVDRLAGSRADAWAVHDLAAKRAADGEDVIFLTIGDPDFATPRPIVDRAIAALDEGDTHYAAIQGRPELREAVAERFTSRSGLAVTADNVVITAGTQNALFAATLCLAERGDQIITTEPMYVTYEATLQAGGAELVTVPSADRFRLDLDAVAAAITPATRAVAITTPANPTGVVASRAELEGLAALAIEHDLWVLADEVYADLVYDGEHVSIASLDGMADRTVTISSLSKSHAMTGWRVGWMIGPEDLVTHGRRLNMAMTYGLPGFIQQAALVGLADADAITATMRDTYRSRRDRTVKALEEDGRLPVLSPAAGMYVMVDVRPTGLTSSEFSWALAEEANVTVLDAGTFGPSAEGWVRLAFTISEERLVEACERITRFAASRMG